MRQIYQTHKRVALVSNDGSEELRGDIQYDSLSMRHSAFMKLDKVKPIDKKVTKSLRFGVEGVSERLRVAVGKPVKNVDLLETSAKLIARGVGVRWFFVIGLPGETATDWLELRELIDGLRAMEKGCVMLNFHAYIPQPATPLCILPLVDEYWEQFEEFRRWFFHGPGFTRRAQLVTPAQYAGRMARAMESMAATEEELRRGWWQHENSNWRVKYPAPPEQLRKVATAYKAKLGF